MSRPVHFQTKEQTRDWTACGKQSNLRAWDYRHVTCLLCRKTLVWKEQREFINKLAEPITASFDEEGNLYTVMMGKDVMISRIKKQTPA